MKKPVAQAFQPVLDTRGRVSYTVHITFQNRIDPSSLVFLSGGFMSDAMPLRLSSLLVCTDGSPASQGAVNAGLWLGRQSGAKVYLLEVANPDAREAVPHTPLGEGEDSLEDIEAKALGAGVDLTVRIHPGGSPLEGILEEVKTVDPDWIILGRKGSTGLSRLLMGSVTARVIGLCPCSVLVVPKEATLRLQRILVASDGSEDSDAAWRQALAIAERANSEVIAVTVARSESLELDCQMILQHLEASAGRHRVAFQGLVYRGRAFEAISQAAQEEWADLVVMGTHGRGGLAHLLMGSVAERVIGLVQCPVLVAKKRKKA
jgi:nucleotide-binding universal stress UspA family protein